MACLYRRKNETIGQGALVWLLGVDSLVALHSQKIRRQQKDWGYSLTLLICLFATVIVGIYSEIKCESAFAVASPFMYIYTNIFVPLQATMFSLLAFFIASAAYRAFRAKTFEASLLLVAAAIVMLGRVPLVTVFLQQLPLGHIWSKLPLLTEWVMNIPQMAAKRGILIGAALGGLAMSLRILLGIERTYLS
ncbi:MAG: hypothetical protein AB1393_13540 [Candidatus Edwardsbacteria bacterium]